MGKLLTGLAWLILGFSYFWMHNHCCGNEELSTPALESADSLSNAARNDSYDFGPLTFQINTPDVQTNESTKAFLLSKLNTSAKDDYLHITGFYRSDEKNNTEFENLGLARAALIKNILSEYTDTTGMTIEGRENENLTVTEKGYFEEVDFGFRRKTAKIKEINDRTLIYFPYNSTVRLEDAEIEAYLNDVVKRVKASGETVYLTGHTDSFGDAEYNYQLGLRRANIIGRYLTSNGVPKSQVKVDSKGEISPIAPNSTDEGRSKNRRTELVIK